jgi:hypothetical protein
MNNKLFLLFSLVLISVLLCSFRKPVNTVSPQPTGISLTIPNAKADTGGRAVSLDSAQICINRFDSLMQAHGFANQAGLPINIRLKKTSQITTAETFNGKDLQDWLNATAAQYTAAGKTLMIKIQMGVYDASYLKTYQPNTSLQAANNNRIAIFIIPYDGATGHAAMGLALPAGGTGSGGGTGYDLGGIQP